MQCSSAVSSLEWKGRWHWVAGLSAGRRKNRKAPFKSCRRTSASGSVGADGKTAWTWKEMGGRTLVNLMSNTLVLYHSHISTAAAAATLLFFP